MELIASWQESFKRKSPGAALAQDLLDLGLLRHPAGAKADTVGAGRLKKARRTGQGQRGTLHHHPLLPQWARAPPSKPGQEEKENQTLT